MTKLRGSSLIEVMVAASILLLILTSAAEGIGFGVRHVGHSRRVAEAERIAAAQMEALLVEGRQQEPAPPAFVTSRFGSSGGAGFRQTRPPEESGTQRFSADGRADPDGDYVARWSIRNGRPVQNGVRLRVDVEWQEGGSARNIGLTSYFAIPDFCDPLLREKRERERERGRGGGGRNSSERDPCDVDISGSFGRGD